MGLQLYDERFPNTVACEIDDSTGTAYTSCFYPNPPGSRVNAIIATSTSASDHDIQLRYGSSPGYLLGTVTIPAGAGVTPLVPAVDIIASLPPIAAGLPVGKDDDLGVVLTVALSAGEAINLVALGGDF